MTSLEGAVAESNNAQRDHFFLLDIETDRVRLAQRKKRFSNKIPFSIIHQDQAAAGPGR